MNAVVEGLGWEVGRQGKYRLRYMRHYKVSNVNAVVEGLGWKAGRQGKYKPKIRYACVGRKIISQVSKQRVPKTKVYRLSTGIILLQQRKL